MNLMKSIAILSLSVFIYGQTSAQKKTPPKQVSKPISITSIAKPTASDTSAMLEHNKMYDCFLDTNYVCFENYMAPELLAFFSDKVKANFTDVMRGQVQSFGDLSFAKHKTTRVVQSVFENGQYQKIIESILEMEIEETKMVSLSYTIAFSKDNTNWKFMRLSSMPIKQMYEAFPVINKKFRIPENQIFYKKTLEQVLKTYKIKYRTS